MFQALGHERSLLQEKIEELKTFERDQRAHLQSYLEGQLIKLDRTEPVPSDTVPSDTVPSDTVPSDADESDESDSDETS